MYLIICSVTLLVSIVSILSGFGVGTVLMPVFALFFPVPIAIAATAALHLANNVFKIFLIGKFATWPVVWRFGLPAMVASAIGAYILSAVSTWPQLASYQMYGHEYAISIVGVSIGLLIIVSSIFDLSPKLATISFPPELIPLGGCLSGLFGGLSGHQGALRSAFLIKAGLSTESFVGTGAVISVFVDLVRLTVYSWAFGASLSLQGMTDILVVATLTAFLGSYIGSRLLPTITFTAVQRLVGIMLFILGLAIVAGF